MKLSIVILLLSSATALAAPAHQDLNSRSDNDVIPERADTFVRDVDTLPERATTFVRDVNMFPERDDTFVRDVDMLPERGTTFVRDVDMLPERGTTFVRGREVPLDERSQSRSQPDGVEFVRRVEELSLSADDELVKKDESASLVDRKLGPDPNFVKRQTTTMTSIASATSSKASTTSLAKSAPQMGVNFV